MSDDLTALANILFESVYHSRRSAKRAIREAGGKGSAEELDHLLAIIKSHPRRREIEDLAGERHGAERAAIAERLTGSPREETPAWLFAESSDARRWFAVHFCPSGAWSFVGELFDDESLAPPAMERYRMTEGQVLSNILWLDGEAPPMPERKALMAECRDRVAAYDAGCEDEFDSEN